MTKEGIAEVLAAEYGIPKTKAKAIYLSLIGAIRKEVDETGVSRVPGLGIFRRYERKGGQARNPKTGKPMKADYRFVTFRTGAEFKRDLNN